jgi:hypothetical protein
MRGDMHQHGSINEPADQYQEADNVYSERHEALPAPTRISPAPATEQKQHQKNNQQSRHGFTFSPFHYCAHWGPKPNWGRLVA